MNSFFKLLCFSPLDWRKGHHAFPSISTNLWVYIYVYCLNHFSKFQHPNACNYLIRNSIEMSTKHHTLKLSKADCLVFFHLQLCLYRFHPNHKHYKLFHLLVLNKNLGFLCTLSCSFILHLIFFFANSLIMSSEYSLSILHSYQLAILLRNLLQRMQQIPNRSSCFFPHFPFPIGFFQLRI